MSNCENNRVVMDKMPETSSDRSKIWHLPTGSIVVCLTRDCRQLLFLTSSSSIQTDCREFLVNKDKK